MIPRLRISLWGILSRFRHRPSFPRLPLARFRTLRGAESARGGIETPLPTLPVARTRIPSVAQLRFLSALLAPRERWTLLVLVVVGILALAVVIGRLASRHVAEVPQAGGTYIEGVVGSPRYLNPVLASPQSVDADLDRLVFSGLFRYNTYRELIPDVAEGYTVSDDGKVYTVTIREGVHWQDGALLSPDDVVFTFGAIQDPLWKSPLASRFRGIGVEKQDERTVRFRLKEPFAPFPSLLTVGILPEHLWGTIPPESAPLSDLNFEPVGSGPYRVKELSLGRRSGSVRSYLLERTGPESASYLDHILVKFYPDKQTLLAEFNARKVDGALIEGTDGDLRRKDLTQHEFVLPRQTAIFINQRANPGLKELPIREALARSLDRERILAEALGGHAELLDGPLTPADLGTTDGTTVYSFDPARADERMSSAGWKRENGKWVKDGKPLSLTLAAADTPENAQLTDMIKSAWETAGFTVSLALADPAKIQREVIKPRKYELLLFRTILGDDPDPYPFWHSSQALEPGLNFSLFVNSGADELLESARKERDVEERTRKYVEFQKIVTSSLPAIFLFQDVVTYALAPKVRGVAGERIASLADRFAGVRDWYVKTRKVWR